MQDVNLKMEIFINLVNFIISPQPIGHGPDRPPVAVAVFVYWECYAEKKVKMSPPLGPFYGVRIGWRKYLYECTPFAYVNL